jgi:hypothetical protein
LHGLVHPWAADVPLLQYNDRLSDKVDRVDPATPGPTAQKGANALARVAIHRRLNGAASEMRIT